MAGLLGQLARRTAEAGASSAGLQVYGWDGDLSDLADVYDLFNVVPGNNCTENQAKAALSIDAGGLVIDSDAAVAAGAGVDCTFDLVLKQHTAPMFTAIANAERLGGTSSLYVRSNPFVSFLRTPAGDPYTPAGGTSYNVGSHCFTNTGARVFMFGSAGQTNAGNGLWLQIVDVARKGTGGSSVGVSSLQCNDNTFSSGSRMIDESDPRGAFDEIIPADHYFDHWFRIVNRFDDGGGLVSGRVYMKFHRWQIISAPKAEA